MRKKLAVIMALVLSLTIIKNIYAWNSLGHRIIAQIAYDQLTTHARQRYNSYNHALDQVYGAKSLVSAAPWLDRLRYRNQLWLQSMHYIDIPYSIDNTPVVKPNKINAVYAINEAVAVLSNKTASAYDKGFSLRILLHVVGDIHQPMHAVSLFSKNYPMGDQGGNLVKLIPNPIGENLHAYWDNGGGYLKNNRYNYKNIAKQAQLLEKRWPCQGTDGLDPAQWANESHQLAVQLAYSLTNGNNPSHAYQRAVKTIAKQRLALAGCRLGNLLNKLSNVNNN